MAAPENGATLVEYVLLVALIALVAFLGVTFFGGAVGDSISRSGSELFPAIFPPWLP
jgi:Flp pilus assembly pilin Flp